MANSKIPPNLEPVILRLAGTGKTTRQIAEALKRRGCHVGHTAIARFLTRTRSARAESAKAVVRTKLAPSLAGDLDALEVERCRLVRLAARLGERVEAKATSATDAAVSLSVRYLRVVDRLAKLTDLKLHYAGADTPDDKPDDGAASRVLGRIAALIHPEADDVEPEPVH